MRDNLFPAICEIVDGFIGQELTPPTGAALVRKLMDALLGYPVDVTQFAPKQVGSYTIQAERFLDVLDQIRVLHEAHWKETEGYRHGLPFNPDYGYFLEKDASGEYLLFTVRKDGHLVGNFGLFLNTSHHTQELVASEDTLFILPEHRVGRLYFRFSEYVDEACQTLGVSELRTSTKLSNHSGDMLPRLGYAHVGNNYVKTFPRKNHVQ